MRQIPQIVYGEHLSKTASSPNCVEDQKRRAQAALARSLIAKYRGVAETRVHVDNGLAAYWICLDLEQNQRRCHAATQFLTVRARHDSQFPFAGARSVRSGCKRSAIEYPFCRHA